MGVLDPAKDQALGSVVADTMVETLALHRIAFQTFDVTPDLIERIRRKGRIIYPDDEDIMRRLKLQVTTIDTATTTICKHVTTCYSPATVHRLCRRTRR